MTLARFRTRAIAAAALFSAACLPEFEVIRGRHIIYEHSDELEPCAATVQYLDRILLFLSEQLGVSMPRRLRYTWLGPEDYDIIAHILPSGAGGSAAGFHAMSSVPAHVHELVHVTAKDWSSLFLTEGLAVAYDPLGGRRWNPELVFDPRPKLVADEVDYNEAGAFVTFLLVRHSPERFFTFFHALRRPVTADKLASAFAAAFGTTLDEEAEIFMAGDLPCRADDFPVLPVDCAAPALERTKWVFDQALECDAPGVVGGVAPDSTEPIFFPATVEITQPGRYELRGGLDPDATVRFGPCFGCPWTAHEVTLRAGRRAELELERGKYYLRLTMSPDGLKDLGFVLRSLD